MAEDSPLASVHALHRFTFQSFHHPMLPPSQYSNALLILCPPILYWPSSHTDSTYSIFLYPFRHLILTHSLWVTNRPREQRLVTSPTPDFIPSPSLDM